MDKCAFNHVKIVSANALIINWASINYTDKCTFNHVKIIRANATK